MKTIITVFVLIIAGNLSAQEDYTIRIQDSSFKIALDKPYDVMIKGKKIKFTVTANDTINYKDDLYSFQYLKDFKISKTEVDEGIEQVMIMTAEGNGILIQKYATMDPSQMNDIMLTEVTKESVNYGFEMKRTEYTRTLKSGQKVLVTKAVLTYKDETNVYEVMSVGGKDEGILVMTMVMDINNMKQGKKIIDLMWESLRVKK